MPGDGAEAHVRISAITRDIVYNEETATTTRSA